MTSLLYSSLVVILLCSFATAAPTAQEESAKIEDQAALQVEDGLLEEGAVRTKKSYPTATVCVEIRPTSPNSKPFTVCEPASGQPIILPPSSGYQSAHQVVAPSSGYPSSYTSSSAYGVTHHNPPPSRPILYGQSSSASATQTSSGYSGPSHHYSGGYRNIAEDEFNDMRQAMMFGNPNSENVGAALNEINSGTTSGARSHHNHHYSPPMYAAPAVYAPPVYSPPIYSPPAPPPVSYAGNSCPTNYLFSCQPNVTPVSCNGQPIYSPPRPPPQHMHTHQYSPQYSNQGYGGYGSYREAEFQPDTQVKNNVHSINNMNFNQQHPQQQQQQIPPHQRFSINEGNHNVVGNEHGPIVQPLHTMATSRSIDDTTVTKATTQTVHPHQTITPTIQPSSTSPHMDPYKFGPKALEKTKEEMLKEETIAKMRSMAEDSQRSKSMMEKGDQNMPKPQMPNSTPLTHNTESRSAFYQNQANYADMRANSI